MAFTLDEQRIFNDLAAYAKDKDFVFNPDASVRDRVIRGLAVRESKTGHRYCPCRLTSKDPEQNAKIVCPCAFHLEELARDGHCHCQLFVRP
ncbi:MAG: ferredoxin:thioredoxin reductase [Planctomycetes bacterium]|nr:ferredoxin:thioredoxin reductase [Planctomycetota bacterium]